MQKFDDGRSPDGLAHHTEKIDDTAAGITNRNFGAKGTRSP